MEQVTKMFDEMKTLWTEFETNHSIYVEKKNKAAAGRARKAINEMKKLVTKYKQESVASAKA
jgi:hypothetical protein